ncbi:MAG: hypothetical protein GF383_08905 [Candidatus Lokiarchaeota archaeon]|nr:hypothetical protein [Candidatus Lokiarchaeota archaeon]MBD3340506.1 hypothetical protein [Candidatus Lokiarchaeota archaeon]
MKKKAKISIDYSKCIEPEKCGKCLTACKQTVFNLTFLDKDYHNPKKWRVIPIFPQLCLVVQNKCNSCIVICPEKAISIEI